MTDGVIIALIAAGSGVPGLVVKLVLNGTAKRTKELVSATEEIKTSLHGHIHQTATNFRETRERGEQKQDEILDRVNAIDVRVARIEGSRWKRRGDE